MIQRATVRFDHNLSARRMIQILDRAEHFKVAVLWEELKTFETNGKVYPEVGIEWDDEDGEPGLWLKLSGIMDVYMEGDE